jgi:hypothetical protein
MLHKQSLLFILILLWASTHARAQSWSGIIDPSRAVDWTGKGVSGGIPTRNTQCGPTIAAYGGTADAINAAIANCTPEQFVKLGVGAFNLSTGITFAGKSSVTLRGSGPDQTFIYFSASASCMGLGGNICVTNPSGINPDNPGQTANWTAGYAKSTTSIILDKTTNLSVGSVLFLDQLNDSNIDNGQLWMCDLYPYCATAGGEGTTRANRAQVQPIVVTAVSGGTVSFSSPGLYMANWRSGQSSQGWWANNVAYGIGIEDMSLDYSAAIGANGIFFGGVRDCWVKGIRSINSNRAAVWIDMATRITIRDSYFYGTQNAASQSYGIETDSASDILVENNIFQHVTAGMPTGKGAVGTVYGYNYSIDDQYCPGGCPGAWQQASSYHHAAGTDFTLFEGNTGIGFTADAIHGTSHFMTAFRNYWNGRDPAGGSSGGKTQQTNAIYIYSFNRYFNIMGNVLGTSGYHTHYECYPATSTTSACGHNADLDIFNLGWSGNEGTKNAYVNNDINVRAFLMRWGNYDVVNGSAQWNASEVPSGISPYSNAVPSSQTLPTSFYLSAKPSWWTSPWGTPPWPAIGPDVSGGNLSGTGGHANMIPAQLCYINSPIDSTYGSSNVRLFSAKVCYGSPAAPTNLKVIPK